MNQRSNLMPAPGGTFDAPFGSGSDGYPGACGATRSAPGLNVEMPDLLSTSAPAVIVRPVPWGAFRFIALLAFSPWLAFVLLSLFTSPERAWSFVASCTWIGTPILVICAGLFCLDHRRNTPNT